MATWCNRKNVAFVSSFAPIDVCVKAVDTRVRNIHDAVVLFKKTGATGSLLRYMSGAEFVIFQKLIERFGSDDVLYSYGLHPRDCRYPFNCDFYVRSMDLFIEVNTHSSHGGHWYDESSHDDRLRVKHLMAGSQKSKAAAHVWTVTDVQKRNAAKENGLRYLVFWDNAQKQCNKKKYFRLKDFYEWFVECDCNVEVFLKMHPENTY